MSTAISMDDFQALEQRVLRAVEIVKREREARAAAEADAAQLREQLEAVRRENGTARQEIADAQAQLGILNQERESVRERVEKLLTQMDELV